MKKGFTLMEVLAVMLVVAVIASLLTPAVRAVRSEVYYHRAKLAALKMAEAIRSYYRDSKGYDISGDFSGSAVNSPDTFASFLETIKDDCPPDSPARMGIVMPTNAGKVKDVTELFQCNYLSWREFEGLPYTFAATHWNDADTLVTYTASDKRAGKYYNENGSTTVYAVLRNMTISGEDD